MSRGPGRNLGPFLFYSSPHHASAIAENKNTAIRLAARIRKHRIIRPNHTGGAGGSDINVLTQQNPAASSQIPIQEMRITLGQSVLRCLILGASPSRYLNHKHPYDTVIRPVEVGAERLLAHELHRAARWTINEAAITRRHSAPSLPWCGSPGCACPSMNGPQPEAHRTQRCPDRWPRMACSRLAGDSGR